MKSSKKAEKAEKMEHFSHKIEGFCNFRNFYREIIEWMPDGGVFVEVGVYWGQSFAFAVVEGINSGKKIDFVAVDAFPDAWTSPEGWHMADKFHHEMQPVEGYYRTIRSASDDAAAHFEDGTVDFVFIDANHTYDFVRRDVLAWLPKVKPGGIIAGHDYNAPHEVERAVNEIFGSRVIPVVSDDNPSFFSWKVQL